jgi:hypothetical protein
MLTMSAALGGSRLDGGVLMIESVVDVEREVVEGVSGGESCCAWAFDMTC